MRRGRPALRPQPVLQSQGEGLFSRDGRRTRGAAAAVSRLLVLLTAALGMATGGTRRSRRREWTRHLLHAVVADHAAFILIHVARATSLAKEPQSHGQQRRPRRRWTGEVAALVHLDVVLVANDILLPQPVRKRTQSTRVNLSPEKKGPFKVRVLASCGTQASRARCEDPGRPLPGALGALLWHLLVIVRAAAAPGPHKPPRQAT